jgi:hypothetical protein
MRDQNGPVRFNTSASTISTEAVILLNYLQTGRKI